MAVNYRKISLDNKFGLSIHWSSDCNMACQYCFIKKDKELMECHNTKIRKALEDGSFVEIIKETFQDNKDIVDSLNLWGAEPTLNGKYFNNFITELLDYFPAVETVMFSTNAYVGGKVIFDDFFTPLYQYCEKNERKLTFELQLSLDGPQEYNDLSRKIGATNNTINTLYYFCDNVPEKSDYLSLEMNVKTTLDICYMKDMLDKGLEAFYYYYGFFDDLQYNAEKKIKNKPHIEVHALAMPTLVDPGTHTIEDGKVLARWILKLLELSRDRFKCHNKGPFFWQLSNGLMPFLRDTNIIAHGSHSYSCSGTKTELTIDYTGRLYGCNRLGKNAVYTIEEQKKNTTNYSATSFDLKDGWKDWVKRTYSQMAFHEDILSRWQMCEPLILLMAKAGQIDEKYLHDKEARLLLFIFTTSISCHIGIEEDLTHNVFAVPTSYLKLFGNGAMDAYIKYITVERDRGYIRSWN